MADEKDRWDKAKVIAEFLKILVIIISAWAINTSLKKQELELEYVRLAIGILQEDAKPETSDLRDWSIEVLKKYSKRIHPLTDGAAYNLHHYSLPGARPRLNDIPDPNAVPDPNWVPK